MSYEWLAEKKLYMLKNKNVRRKHKHLKIMENVPRFRIFCYHSCGDPITESSPKRAKGCLIANESRSEKKNYPGGSHDRANTM